MSIFAPATKQAQAALPSFEELKNDFTLFRDRQRSLDELNLWRDIAKEQIAYLSERIFLEEHSHLEAIGATYTGYGQLHRPLNRIDQQVLEEAFIKKLFYEQLLMHPSILTAYQGIERAGFKGVSAAKFPSQHELLDTKNAFSFDDFGFLSRAPAPEDNVIESTTEAICRGAAFSWATHAFPSQYVMGSSMPDLWGDLGLASLAKLFCIAITPCDGDVGRREDQLARYISAKNLILNDPSINYHPYKDYMLPSGDKLGDFVKKRALAHLGAALKPGKGIAKKYAPLIEDHGCRIVEVYDPGCTNLIESSVAELRDSYGDKIEILCGRIPQDPDLKSFANLLIRLSKHRVTLRIGLLDGKICSTHAVTGGMAPENLQTAVRAINLHGQILAATGHHTPVSVEGGASSRLGLAIACGINAVGISGSLGGGSVEHIPPLFEYSNGRKPYSGEASPATKAKSGKLNAVGDEIQVEGYSGATQPRSGIPNSIAKAVNDRLYGITKALRFMRYNSVIEAQGDPGSAQLITKFSPSASDAAKVHI
ncbi:MAG: hypothetical protein ACK5Y6_08375 [Pseudomonadota bacterium]|jgi:hypothetical protein